MTKKQHLHSSEEVGVCSRTGSTGAIADTDQSAGQIRSPIYTTEFRAGRTLHAGITERQAYQIASGTYAAGLPCHARAC